MSVETLTSQNSIMKKMKTRWQRLRDYFLPTYRAKIVAVLCAGTVVGLVVYLVYMSKAYSYLSDEPSVCINCHVMEPYYATWNHSSHALHATCNDCHVPHTSIFHKYFFKAKDGLRHSYVFTMRGEPQAMQAIPESQAVIYQNCVRCHSQLSQEFVHSGRVCPVQIKEGSEQACWDCHRDVPHGGKIGLSATPAARVPFPKSPVPDWLRKAVRKSDTK